MYGTQQCCTQAALRDAQAAQGVRRECAGSAQDLRNNEKQKETGQKSVVKSNFTDRMSWSRRTKKKFTDSERKNREDRYLTVPGKKKTGKK